MGAMAVIAHQSHSWPSSKASNNAELKPANRVIPLQFEESLCVLGIIHHSAQRQAYTLHRTRSVPSSGALPDARTNFCPRSSKHRAGAS